VMAKVIPAGTTRTVMPISAIAWFPTAPVWMKAE